jgi:hypothetical protein
MTRSTQAATAPRRVPPSSASQFTAGQFTAGQIAQGDFAAPEATGIAWLGPVDVENHIIVLGGQGPELMCALLRAGASHVTHLRAHERPEADSASLVIVPRIPSLEWLATALLSIRRALTPRGRLVLRTGQAVTQTQVRRMLTLLGMTAISSRTTPDGQVLSAELPTRRFA